MSGVPRPLSSVPPPSGQPRSSGGLASHALFVQPPSSEVPTSSHPHSSGVSTPSHAPLAGVPTPLHPSLLTSSPGTSTLLQTSPMLPMGVPHAGASVSSHALSLGMLHQPYPGLPTQSYPGVLSSAPTVLSPHAPSSGDPIPSTGMPTSSCTSLPEVPSTSTHPFPGRGSATIPLGNPTLPTSQLDPTLPVTLPQPTAPVSSVAKETSPIATGTHHLGYPDKPTAPALMAANSGMERLCKTG